MLTNTISEIEHVINHVINAKSLSTEASNEELEFNSITLTGASCNSPKKITPLIYQWLSKRKPYLEFRILDSAGIYVRLNRAHCYIDEDSNGIQHLRMRQKEAVSIYVRRRLPWQTSISMKKVTNLETDMDQKVKTYIAGLECQIKEYKNRLAPTEINGMPTLREYLLVYPKLSSGLKLTTVQANIANVKRAFSHLLDKKVDKITGTDIHNYLNNIKSKDGTVSYCNQMSTIHTSKEKNRVYSLRAILRSASLNSYHKFELCNSLSSNIKFNIDDTKDRSINEDDLKRLVHALAQRDHTRTLKGNQNSCPFHDYLTPLIILGLSTGLRPKYALRLKWSHIDYKNKIIHIHGDGGKIKKSETVSMTEELEGVLKDWKKHAIHLKSKNNWVFPSPRYLDQNLKYYERQLNNLRDEHDLKNVVMYGMRHTFASNYLRYSQDIGATQGALHHKDPNTTRRYAPVLQSTVKRGHEKFERSTMKLRVANNELVNSKAS